MMRHPSDNTGNNVEDGPDAGTATEAGKESRPPPRISWLALLLLLLAAAALAQRLLLAEGTEQRLQRLQFALQVKEQVVDQLQDASALLDVPAGETAARLAELNGLLSTETALAAQHNALALLVPTAIARMSSRSLSRDTSERRMDLEGTQLLRAAILSAQALDRSLRQEIAATRAREHMAWRWSLLAATILTALGVALLLLSLRRARLAALHNAGQAALVTAELKAIYDAVPIGLALVEDDLCIRGANPCFAQLAGHGIVAEEQEEGRPALGGRHIAQAVPQLAASLIPMLQAAIANGEGLPGQELAAEGVDGLLRHYFVAAEPVRAELQRSALSLVLMDVTDRAKLHAWHSELVAELNHRVKNTLATVQSLAAQTLRGAGHDPQRFAADFSARLGALSRSHELLAAIGWVEATIQATVTTALSPWASGGHLAMVGPPGLALRPAQSQALVIALTEMAGNSVRFGAMGSSGGHVILRWEAMPDGLARMTWQERGGPQLAGPPLRRGFGLRFLERGLAHDLGRDAQVRLRFEPAGFTCEVSFRPGDIPRQLPGLAA
jgi:two-component sensor histidine kinase